MTVLVSRVLVYFIVLSNRYYVGGRQWHCIYTSCRAERMGLEMDNIALSVPSGRQRLSSIYTSLSPIFLILRPSFVQHPFPLSRNYSTQTTFSACGSKVKSLTRQSFNARMGRNGGSCSYDTTQFVNKTGLCITCTARRESEKRREQARLEGDKMG